MFYFLLVRLKATACGVNLCFIRNVLIVRPKTIVFGRTCFSRDVLFILIPARDLRDAWADQRKILHDG